MDTDTTFDIMALLTGEVDTPAARITFTHTTDDDGATTSIATGADRSTARIIADTGTVVLVLVAADGTEIAANAFGTFAAAAVYADAAIG